MKPLIIIGVGGFGRETAWIVQKINKNNPTWEFKGFVDLYDNNKTQTVEGYPILGDLKWLKQVSPDAYLVCAIGDPVKRYKLTRELEDIGFSFGTLIDPSVQMSDFIKIGEGSIICASCILTTNINIGKHVLLNLGCTVGHDTILEDYFSAMPGVNIAGDVKIGTGTYFGTGATIIDKLTVGAWSVIGAGAVVTKNIPANVMAVGVPAKIMKEHKPILR
ncbi:MAG: acetyltransferase [Bacillota bacterium]